MAANRTASAIPGPRHVLGVRALLFERLVDERHPDPYDPAAPPDRLLDLAALRRSIGRELGHLFNTRAPVDAEALDQRQRSTIDYGIPDLSLYAPNDQEAVARLARHLTLAVEAYEPRLLSPRVKVVPYPEQAGKLLAEIAGDMRLGDEVEAVNFRFGLGGEARHG